MKVLDNLIKKHGITREFDDLLVKKFDIIEYSLVGGIVRDTLDNPGAFISDIDIVLHNNYSLQEKYGGDWTRFYVQLAKEIKKLQIPSIGIEHKSYDTHGIKIHPIEGNLPIDIWVSSFYSSYGLKHLSEILKTFTLSVQRIGVVKYLAIQEYSKVEKDSLYSSTLVEKVGPSLFPNRKAAMKIIKMHHKYNIPLGMEAEKELNSQDEDSLLTAYCEAWASIEKGVKNGIIV